MSWQTGTATDYRDMLDQLIEIAISDHVDTAAVGASGGTGYAVDDIITITDGTKTHSATLRVTSESGGVIDGIQIEEGGAYTVDPDLTDTTAHTVAPSGASGAQFDLTMNSEPWTVERRAQEAVSAVVATAGTGYNVSDQITLVMSPGFGVLGSNDDGVLPVFNVDTVGGGGDITGVSLVTAGHIEEAPDSDGAGGLQATVSGGTGTGAVLTVTYQDVASSEEDVVILSGPGEGGTDQILVGFRTFQATDVSTFDTVYNWQLFGMTEYNAALALQDQVNISYGLTPITGAQKTDGGCFMVLKENDADPDIEFWVSVTNRRIILICKVESAGTTFYSSMYLGFLNAFATTAEEPYPLWIQGCTSRENSRWDDTTVGRISSLVECGSISGKANGPAQYRVNGVWTAFRNFNIIDGGSPSRSSVKDFTVYPAGLSTLTPDSDDIITSFGTSGSSLRFQDLYPLTGAPGTPNMQLRPTPNTGDDIRIMVPLSPMVTDDPVSGDVYIPVGELDNVFWISAADATTPLTSEDVQKVGDVRYIVFQNGNQADVFSYFCVKAE